MIISDEHKFVFIHIPKCAGTTVRGILEPFDSRSGEYTSRVDYHPELGELDYVHIPLFVLRDHFCPEFEVIKHYFSFSIVRNPYSRFASSVSQRLNMYSNKPIHKRSFKDIDSRVREIIDFLSHHDMEQFLLPPEYIHFQRQIDYISLDGQRIISGIYTVNQINELLFDVSRHIGWNLSDLVPEGAKTAENQTNVFRNELLRQMIEKVRPASGPLLSILPEKLKQKVRDRIYVPRDQRMRKIFEADHVRSFVRDYYSEDINLHLVAQSENRSVRR